MCFIQEDETPLKLARDSKDVNREITDCLNDVCT